MATSRAVAAVKRAKVVEAMADGATYKEAAKLAGYATRSGAYKAFWKAIDGREADAVDQHRMLEVQRLDALQVAAWDKAMGGDVRAILAVIRLVEHRSRLLGLDRPALIQFIDDQVSLMNADLARYEQVKKVAILPQELSMEAGELTPTMKLKRKQIKQTNADTIAALYETGASS